MGSKTGRQVHDIDLRSLKALSDLINKLGIHLLANISMPESCLILLNAKNILGWYSYNSGDEFSRMIVDKITLCLATLI